MEFLIIYKMIPQLE